VTKIIKVDDSMFEEAYELFLGFKSTGISEERWRRLLRPQWRLDGTHCGLGLVDKGRLVGFIGTLFSERVINGRVERFCNLSSLIVRPAYRRHGPTLMLSAVREKNCTITIFTPRRVVYSRAPAIGFRNLGTRMKVMLPVPLGEERVRRRYGIAERPGRNQAIP
jgi:GNAT superfamily N-acetyltransferase